MMKAENVRRWEKLEAQLRSSQPGVLQALRPPVLLDDIRAVEKEMGLVFPDDLRDAYLRHDGVDWIGAAQVRPVLLPLSVGWLPLQLVLELWREHFSTYMDFFADLDGDDAENWNEYPDEKVRSQMLLPEWIPIGRSAGIALCIDLVPGLAGVSGQLIYHWYSGGATVIATSFGAYLDLLIASLANGTSGWPHGEFGSLKLGEASAAELAGVTQSSATSAEALLPSFPPTEPPTIIQQPTPACVDAGATATFSVSATGGEHLRYQWSRNGLAIPGGDASEFQMEASAASIGKTFQITVSISNAAGLVTSEPVTMTVTHPVGGVVVEQAVSAADGARLTVGPRAAVNIYVQALAEDAHVRVVAEQADRLNIAVDCIAVGDVVTVSTGGVAFATPLWLEVREPQQVAEGRVLALLELGVTAHAAGADGAGTTPVLQVLGLSAQHARYGTLTVGLKQEGRYLLAQVPESAITGELG